MFLYQSSELKSCAKIPKQRPSSTPPLFTHSEKSNAGITALHCGTLYSRALRTSSSPSELLLNLPLVDRTPTRSTGVEAPHRHQLRESSLSWKSFPIMTFWVSSPSVLVHYRSHGRSKHRENIVKSVTPDQDEKQFHKILPAMCKLMVSSIREHNK